MSTIFSHPAVPVAMALALGQKRIPRSLLVIGAFCAILPDFDSIGFAFGIPYESQFGHRGFTHSVFFAVLIAAFFAWRNKEFTVDGAAVKRHIVFAFLFISMVSHPLLDALTDGGEGVAIWWPFSKERFFFDDTPLPVCPIGQNFFSAAGYAALRSELTLIWLPALSLGLGGFIVRKISGRFTRTGRA
ncbi:MAG: metal-dependent hydrolase [bacterium]|nr:metal-dependent hydrolase [bacterium]